MGILSYIHDFNNKSEILENCKVTNCNFRVELPTKE